MKELNLNLNRLKAERVAKGWDQEEFAHKIGMSRVSYWKRENGVVDISVTELAKMLQVLGYGKNDVSLFFTQSVPKKQQKRGGKMKKKSIVDKETAMLIAKKYLVVCKYCHHAVHNGNYCENCGHKLN